MTFAQITPVKHIQNPQTINKPSLLLCTLSFPLFNRIMIDRVHSSKILPLYASQKNLHKSHLKKNDIDVNEKTTTSKNRYRCSASLFVFHLKAHTARRTI